MEAISGFFLLDKGIDLGERSLQKLRLLFKKLVTKTNKEKEFGFGYLKSSVDGSKFKSETFKSEVLSIWENELKDFKIENDTTVFISKTYAYPENQIQQIDPFIFEETYTFVIGLKTAFSLDLNPSEIIAKKGFLTGIAELREAVPTINDFNIVSFSLKNPNIINLYRGLLPFYVVYSFDFNGILFTSNHSDIQFILKEDLLRLSRFLPIDLDPYSSYLIDSTKITFADQEVLIGDHLCCHQLEEIIQKKKLILDFTSKKLYHPNDKIFFKYCPFCGQAINYLIED